MALILPFCGMDSSDKNYHHLSCPVNQVKRSCFLTTLTGIIKISGMKTIAFFDFDGTITVRDTLIDFTRYAFGNIRFGTGVISLLPVLILFYFKHCSRDQVARRFIRFFYRNQDILSLQKKSRDYISCRLPVIINPEVYKAFCRHRDQKHKLVIVSASPSIWLAPWCAQQNVELLATQMEKKGENFTGSITGQRCIGTEKVKRIEQVFSLSDFDKIYAYGNSAGDFPMLNMADHAYYVKEGKLTDYHNDGRA